MFINKFILYHLLLALGIMGLDRFSKTYALAHCAIEQKMNSFFSCYLTFNRGISWGMFHDANRFVFLLVTLLIACITAYIAYLTLVRLREKKWSIGYILVVAGSASNIIDRVMYGAVVDFISFSYAGWNFPVFNVADISIVTGIGLIFLSLMHVQQKA